MFSKKEIDYLKGKIKPNHNYERVLRSRISRKLHDLKTEAIPLLIGNDFTRKRVYELIRQLEIGVTEISNGVTECSNTRKEALSLKSKDLNNETKRRRWDSNPRDLTVTDLAGLRPTRLGDPGSRLCFTVNRLDFPALKPSPQIRRHRISS